MSETVIVPYRTEAYQGASRARKRLLGFFETYRANDSISQAVQSGRTGHAVGVVRKSVVTGTKDLTLDEAFSPFPHGFFACTDPNAATIAHAEYGREGALELYGHTVVTDLHVVELEFPGSYVAYDVDRIAMHFDECGDMYAGPPRNVVPATLDDLHALMRGADQRLRRIALHMLLTRAALRKDLKPRTE